MFLTQVLFGGTNRTAKTLNPNEPNHSWPSPLNALTHYLTLGSGLSFLVYAQKRNLKRHRVLQNQKREEEDSVKNLTHQLKELAANYRASLKHTQNISLELSRLNQSNHTLVRSNKLLKTRDNHLKSLLSAYHSKDSSPQKICKILGDLTTDLVEGKAEKVNVYRLFNNRLILSYHQAHPYSATTQLSMRPGGVKAEQPLNDNTIDLAIEKSNTILHPKSPALTGVLQENSPTSREFSRIAIPIRNGNLTIGALEVQAIPTHSLSEELCQELEYLALLCSLILQLAYLQEELETNGKEAV